MYVSALTERKAGLMLWIIHSIIFILFGAVFAFMFNFKNKKPSRQFMQQAVAYGFSVVTATFAIVMLSELDNALLGFVVMLVVLALPFYALAFKRTPAERERARRFGNDWFNDPTYNRR